MLKIYLKRNLAIADILVLRMRRSILNCFIIEWRRILEFVNEVFTAFYLKEFLNQLELQIRNVKNV